MTKEEYEQIISQIDEAIVNLSTGKVKSYKLGDRSFTYYDLNELIYTRDYYKKQMIEEEGNYIITKLNINNIKPTNLINDNEE